MAVMPWVKLYTEILDDPKMGKMSDTMKWKFIQLVLLAGECDSEGVIPMDWDDIAWRLREEPEVIKNAICYLCEQDLLDLSEGDAYVVVINFSKRQGRSQSEKRKQWRDRQKRHREKEKDVTGDTGVTNGGVTPVEKRRGEERREEQEGDTVDLFTAYEQNIGALTPMLSEQIKDWEDNYAHSWIIEAIEAAVLQEVRKPAYISAILKNWHANGKGKPGDKPPSPASLAVEVWQ